MEGNGAWVAVCPLGAIGWFDTEQEARGFLRDVHCDSSRGSGPVPLGRVCREPIGLHSAVQFFEKGRQIEGSER